MFYPLNWFSRPQYLHSFRTALIEWAKTGDRLILMATEEDDPSLVVRPFTEEDEGFLNYLLMQSWYDEGYGGCHVGRDLNDINGFCYFSLHNDRKIAALSVYLAGEELADLGLYRSPILHLALTELLNDLKGLEQVILPLAPETEEDVQVMASFNLAPGGDPGIWVRQVTPKAKRTYEFENGVNWYELRLKMEPGVDRMVGRIMTRHGCDKEIYKERKIITLENGDGVADETSPVTMFVYLPATVSGQEVLENIETDLMNLQRVQPLGDLRVSTVSFEEFKLMKSGFTTLRAGKRVVVKLHGSDYEPDGDELLVEVTGNQAVFGVAFYGLHPTTRSCIELLEKHLDPAQHRVMLDLGTGNGGLSILAARLGVERILALDADKHALWDAELNVAFNGFQDRIELAHGSLGVITTKWEGGYFFPASDQSSPPSLPGYLPFDIIVSNTYANFIIGLAHSFHQSLRPGGLLLVSGIANVYQPEVMTTLEKAGFEWVDYLTNENWITLLGRKR